MERGWEWREKCPGKMGIGPAFPAEERAAVRTAIGYQAVNVSQSLETVGPSWALKVVAASVMVSSSLRK
jgi:hypothetical protein